MRRRDLIACLAGAAALRPPTGAAQPHRARRVGAVVIKAPETDLRVAAFEGALGSIGWTKGGNLRIDYRFPEPDRERLRAAETEIIALDPEVILVQSTPGAQELLRIARTIPVVFVHVSDPVGSGIVASFAHPGGNATGFTDIEASLGGKWLQLLKEAAPSVIRAALLFNPETAPDRGEFFLAPFKAAGTSLDIAASAAPVHDVHDIEMALAALSATPGGGIAVTAESFMGRHSAEIVALAERFRLPAVYPGGLYAAKGGLISYGIDSPDLFRRAASYVDRILKGTKPADLPVQQPTRFVLSINLKAAKALGLTVPQSLLQRADEVIE